MKSTFFFLVSLTFLFLNACVSIPKKAPINANIQIAELKNGFSYYLLPHQFPKNRCFVRLNVKVGSFNEQDNELGIAHLIEHLAFESRVMGKDKDLAIWFQEQGMRFGPDANAFTSTNYTVYHMDLPHCEGQTLNDAFTILSSFMDSIKFEDEYISKQKSIVDREEESYINGLSKLSKTITHKLFMGTLYDTRPVLGTKTIRDAISKEQLANFYQKWYRPDNAQIVVVGAFNQDLTKELITRHFGHLSTKNRPAMTPLSLGTPSAKEPIFITNSSELKAVETVFILQPKQLLPKSPSTADMRRRLAYELAIMMLNTSLTNKAAKQRADEIEPTSMVGFLGASQEPELTLKIYTTKEHLTPVLKRAFSPIKRALDLGFSQEQFDEAMRKKLDAIEQTILREESATSTSWAQAIVDHINQRGLAFDAKSSAPMVKEFLTKITPNECRDELRKAFKHSNTYLLSYGQIEENEENKAMLEELLKEILSSKGEAKKDKSTEELRFRYAVENSTAAILDKKHFSPIDADAFRLPNNVHVLLKSTTLQKDSILIRITTPAGLIHMSDKELAAAELAGTTLLYGGLKKQSWQEIVKLGRDKMLRIWPGGSLASLNLSASTRATDMRFTLEILRAFLTEPDFNDLALSQSKKQFAINHEENQHRISWPFQSAFPALLSDNDPRATDIPLAAIQELSREDLLAWHEKWVAHQPLFITIVGDFDKELMAKEIAHVFGSLEPRPALALSPPKPIHYKKGIHHVYEVDSEPQPSKALIRYSLETAKRESPHFVLALSQQIIAEALRVKLREKNQSIYSPQVFLVQDNNGYTPNAVDILLSNEKTTIENLRDRTIKHIAKLASKGITAKQLELAKKTSTEAIKKQEENIGFWFDYLSNHQHRADKLMHPNALARLIEKVSIKDINAYLKKYFTLNNASWAITHSKEKPLSKE